MNDIKSEKGRTIWKVKKDERFKNLKKDNDVKSEKDERFKK